MSMFVILSCLFFFLFSDKLGQRVAFAVTMMVFHCFMPNNFSHTTKNLPHRILLLFLVTTKKHKATLFFIRIKVYVLNVYFSTLGCFD